MTSVEFRPASKTRLKNSIQNTVRRSTLAKATSLSTIAAFALFGSNSYAATLDFSILPLLGEGRVHNVDEPTGAAGTAISVDIGPRLVSDNENWIGTCTVSGQVLISSADAPATAGSDYEVPQSLEFSIEVDASRAIAAPSSQSRFNSKPFDQASETINLNILSDHETEENEAINIQFTNVTASCFDPIEGGQVDVIAPFYNPYGMDIVIGDTLNPREEPGEDSKDVPQTQKTLVDQVEEISLLTLHTAATRTRSLSSELRKARRGLKGVSTDNLQVRVNGQTIPGSVWQSMINENNVLSSGSAGDDESNGFGRWGLFVSGSIEMGERKSSVSENSEYDSSLIILGVDYQVNDNVILGGALSQTNLSSELDSKTADTDFQRSSLSLFSSFYHEDKYYLDLIATYGSSNYDLNRKIVDESASADTDGTELSYSLGGGYDFHVENIDIGLFSTVNFLESTIDGYTETTTGGASAAQVNEITLNSMVANVGMDVRWNISTNSGVVSPHIGVTFEHQFDDDPIDVNGNFIGGADEGEFEFQSSKIDSDYFSTQLGLTASFKGGFTTYVMYDTFIDRDDLSSNSYSLGARWQF